MISIIIPSYQTEKIIDHVLAAAYSQKTTQEYEVILVDSTPGEAIDLIAKKYPKLIFLKQSEKTSASKGRNIGASKAHGSLFLFLDADVTLASDAIEKIAEHYKSGHKVFSGSFTLDNSLGFSLMSFLEFSFYFSESFAGNPNRKRKNLPSTLLAVDRDLFNSAGPFIEYGRIEDSYLTEKIKKSGTELFFFPDIKASFFQEVTFIHFLKKCYFNGINVIYLRLGENLTLTKRLLVFFILPFFATAKMLLMIFRNFMYRTEVVEKLLFLATLPLIALGMFFWFLGALNVVLLNPGVDQRR